MFGLLICLKYLYVKTLFISTFKIIVLILVVDDHHSFRENHGLQRGDRHHLSLNLYLNKCFVKNSQLSKNY